jgi:hypothetical protein
VADTWNKPISSMPNPQNLENVGNNYPSFSTRIPLDMLWFLSRIASPPPHLTPPTSILDDTHALAQRK